MQAHLCCQCLQFFFVRRHVHLLQMCWTSSVQSKVIVGSAQIVSIIEKRLDCDAQTQCRARIALERNQRTWKEQHSNSPSIHRFKAPRLFCLARFLLDKPGCTYCAYAACCVHDLCCMLVLAFAFLEFVRIVDLTLSTSLDSAAHVFEGCARSCLCNPSCSHLMMSFHVFRERLSSEQQPRQSIALLHHTSSHNHAFFLFYLTVRAIRSTVCLAITK